MEARKLPGHLPRYLANGGGQAAPALTHGTGRGLLWPLLLLRAFFPAWKACDAQGTGPLLNSGLGPGVHL